MRKKRAQKGGEICRAEATGCGFARNIVFCDDVWLPDYKLPTAHFFIQTVGNGNHRPVFSGAPERIQNLLLCNTTDIIIAFFHISVNQLQNIQNPWGFSPWLLLFLQSF